MRVPELARRADALYERWTSASTTGPRSTGSSSTSPRTPVEAPCCYDTIVSESRIAYYVGIEKGDLPSSVYYGPVRTFPETCAGSFQETRPAGFTRSYEGRSVFEGSYPYGGTRLVPSWGGSMFEALMPPLFVPEERWGPGSWAVNHPLTVDAQIDHGLNVAGYDAWGFSPSTDTVGGYSHVRRRRDRDGPERQPVQPRPHARRPRLRPPGLHPAGHAGPAAERVQNGIVTPHAAFLALRWRPREALAALAALEDDSARGPRSASTTRSTSTPARRSRRTSRSTRG